MNFPFLEFHKRHTKTLVLMLAFSLQCSTAMGQAGVYFRNRISGLGGVDAPFFDEQGTLLEGTNYVAQLYAWKAGLGFLPAGSPEPFATNGYFYGNTVVVQFLFGCLPAWVQVRAWNMQGGPTFEQAALAGAWTGVSEVLFLPQTGTPDRPEACVSAALTGLTYPGTPIIVRQPQNLAVFTGQTAALSVIASSGVRMSYQWFQELSERPDRLIAGATNATYTTSPLSSNTTYWVSITDSTGSVLSDKATVTVVPTVPSLAIERAAGLPMLTLDASVGVTYRIEYSTNLIVTNWTSLVELWLSTSPFAFIDSGATNSPTRFYRMVAPP